MLTDMPIPTKPKRLRRWGEATYEPGKGGVLIIADRSGISMPIVIGVGAGLLALDIMIESAGRDELV